MPGKEIAKNPPQTPNKPSDKKKKIIKPINSQGTRFMCRSVLFHKG